MITRDNYYKDRTHISNSGLKKMDCPAKFYYEYYQKEPDPDVDEKDHFRQGRLFHSLVLEPDNFKKEYMLVNKIDGRLSDASDKKLAQAEALNGRTPIYNWKEYDQFMEMRDSVYSHPIAGKLCMADGEVEKVITWTDPDTGVKCKAMQDKVLPNNLIIDLKTTGVGADMESFRREAFKRKYHQQDAFYRDGSYIDTGMLHKFVFIVVEKEPPYITEVYVLSSDIVHQGREMYKSALDKYKKCKSLNHWPSYNMGQLKIIE